MACKIEGLNVNFCCEAFLVKVLENRIQFIPTGDNTIRVFTGRGWEIDGERCPSFKFCPYCGRKINE